jgi:hypothetical protein
MSDVNSKIPQSFNVSELDENEDELFSEADYQAIKQIAIRNGGKVTMEEIFSIIVRGYMKSERIRNRLFYEKVIKTTEVVYRSEDVDV